VNIGFLQFGGRGDMVMATAVLAAVRRKHPTDNITWMCLDEYREVLADLPLIDSYIAWPLTPGIKRQHQELERWTEIKRYAARTFDKVYIPQHYPDHFFHNTRPGLHLIDQMFLNAALEPDEDRHVGHYRRDHIVRTGTIPIVALNSQGVCQGSLWTDDRWHELRSKLEAAGFQTTDGNTLGVSWRQWGRAIEASSAYVGLDSGGTWLAATTDTPQIVMRASTNDNPKWLTGFTEARIKSPDLFAELIDPTPDEVFNVLKDRWLH
jgi:hypothetical protein